VHTLEQTGVQQIVAVPLLVSSASEVMRQFEYLLGLRADGPWDGRLRPVAMRVPVVMTAPLDDDPVVADVLLERAQGLSRQAQDETVVLVAHGPTSDTDDEQWLSVLGETASQVQERGGFGEVVAVTMRDDAPPAVQAEAQRRMREIVRVASLRARVLVVPVLIASGGVEQKIPRRLHGLAYTYDGNGLLPHPKLAQWIVKRVAQAVEAGSRPAGGSVAQTGRL
jgi:sirohydrochlorin ferrochelatase